MKTKTLLILAFISLFQNLLFSQEKGKIIYTDFEPDSLIYPVWFAGNPLDVNYDGIKELKFKRESRWGYGELYYNADNIRIRELPSDSISSLSSYINWWHYVELIPYGDYNVGIRYTIEDGVYCYGWIRFNIKNLCDYDHDPSITIYEMAYCTIPNYPLKFGQKDFVDIEENIYEMSDVNLFPNPVGDKLSLQLPLNTHCNEVKIYNIAGILLKTQNNNFDNIDLSYLSQGVYIVKINLNDGYICTKKIVKK